MERNSRQFELRTIAVVREQRGAKRRGRRVHVCTNKVGAALVASKGCMASPDLHAVALGLCAVSLKNDIALSTQYLAGDGTIVAGASGLSRIKDEYNCVLKVPMFQNV